MRRVTTVFLTTAVALAPDAASAQSAQGKQSELTPIIAELRAQPSAFAGKSVTIYGLVIEADPSHTRFTLQDVSQQPLAIVGNERLKAKVGDQLIVIGTVRMIDKEVFIVARALLATRVLGGGGCC